MAIKPRPAPVNPKATVPAVHVDSISDHDDDGHVPAGYFTFCDGYDGTRDVSILHGCPCGCGVLGAISLKRYGNSERPVWQWDGNREKPTLTPSILIYQLDENGNVTGEHWHGYLTEGVFRSC